MVGPWYPDGWPEPEITYFLLKDFVGQGYATEAIRAALDWVFAQGWTTAISAIAPENTASVGIAERLNGIPEGMVTIPPDREMQVYRYPTPEAA